MTESNEPAALELAVRDADVGSDPPQPARSKAKLITIVLALFVSLFLAALDYTIVSPAIPTIAAHFHSASVYAWIGSAYILANAAFTVIWSKVSDIWGRKPALLMAIAIFFVGSALSGAARSTSMMIVGRAVQGSAAGGLIVLVSICISDLFSMRQRSLILGWTNGVWALASGIGPVLGGAFTEQASWRWCWYINLPFSALAFLLIFLLLDVHNPKTPFVAGLKAIDWFGSLAILGVTIMLLLGLQFGGVTFPWNSPTVICLIVFGLVMIAVFAVSEAKLARFPLMPLELFRSKSNVAVFIVCFPHGMIYVSIVYFLPLYFQAVGEASPLISGVLVLPVAILECVVGVLAGYINQITGRYLEVIVTGTAAMTLGCGLLIDLGASFSLPKVIIYQLVVGVGTGLLYQPPLIALQTLVKSQEDVAAATATFSFVRNLAAAISVMAGQVVFQNGMEAHASLLSESLPASIADLFLGRDAAANVVVIRGLSVTQKLLVKRAFAASMRNIWIMYTCVAAVGLLASLLIGKHTLSTQHSETKTGIVKEKETEAR
ncbi:hypothetical protein LTR50_002392 [Elasticomyces elasticus]|nr:hypothetical protein LTR50_002392 [Elasticomyces elasticus]